MVIAQTSNVGWNAYEQKKKLQWHMRGINNHNDVTLIWIIQRCFHNRFTDTPIAITIVA